MFASLVAIGAGERGAPISSDVGFALCWTAVISFVVASVTDFLDGWLARRWNATSVAGAVLDPIADKVLVCGAIVGMMATGMPYTFAAMGGLILFREFAVSAMREVLAPRGIKLPVTFLAKSKTTLQLVALGAVMVIAFWPAWGIAATIAQLSIAWQWAQIGLAVATAVTLWTGVQYAQTAVRALRTAAAPPAEDRPATE